MNERSKKISKLLSNSTSRASYINSKLNVLIPSQIRALRLRRDNMTQKQLAALAEMAQPRISAMERPGATKFNLETLVRLASAFKVGLKVEFVAFSEMLDWENSFSQDSFDATKLDNDVHFLNPMPTGLQALWGGSAEGSSAGTGLIFVSGATTSGNYMSFPSATTRRPNVIWKSFWESTPVRAPREERGEEKYSGLALPIEQERLNA